jgi:hypothetical protein
VVFIIKEENLELFRQTVGNRIAEKIRVSYVFQSVEDLPEGLVLPEGRVKPWGTAHAVYCAREVVKENFAVINADDFYGRDTFHQLARHLSKTDLSGDVAHHCMIGFRVGNTLTENGTVSRGVCEVDQNGMLSEVVERTKIEKRDTCAAYLADDSESWIDLDFDTVVSMNCWGFTPDIFGKLEEQFRAFYAKNADNPLKSEFYLPTAVQQQKDSGICDVRVYPTQSRWYGVTYSEDKPRVKAAIGEMVQSGEYPADLWAD